MRIRHGVRPVKHDRRDYSFHRTFPWHAQRLGGTELPLMIYNYDAGFGMPDQNADGLIIITYTPAGPAGPLPGTPAKLNIIQGQFILRSGAMTIQ